MSFQRAAEELSATPRTRGTGAPADGTGDYAIPNFRDSSGLRSQRDELSAPPRFEQGIPSDRRTKDAHVPSPGRFSRFADYRTFPGKEKHVRVSAAFNTMLAIPGAP
jgi:hypothetical protein